MRRHLLEIGLAAALVACVLFAFGDLIWGGPYQFVNFDDHEYVVDNPHVHGGLRPEGVSWALTTYHHFNWHPLTWLSLQLDHQLYGLSPRGYHATNVLLHAANAVLLFLFLRRTTGAPWPSAAVAGLFALHPLHAESVAWVTERKDVLSTFFWFLTLIAYARYAERPGVGRYLAALACFALGLASKPMLVTVPCLLLLLDQWPLRRWPGGVPLRRLLLEKVPFFALSAVSSALTMRAASSLIGVANRDVSFPLRLSNAVVSYATYLRQTLWPDDLAALYLHPAGGIPTAHVVAAGLILGCATYLAVRHGRSRPYLLVGWLWYLGTLVPVIGLLQVAEQARADRFTYVPLVGVFVAAVWGLCEAFGSHKFGRAALGAAAVAVLLACALATRAQLAHWRDSEALWDRAVAVGGDDPRLHHWAATMHVKSGAYGLAIRHAERLRELAPDDPRGHRVLALALLRSGRDDDAVRAMSREAELLPESAEVRAALARVLWKQGKIPAAYERLAEVARLAPDSAEGRHYRGIDAQRQGKFAEAVRLLDQAVVLAPDNPRYRADLALLLGHLGERDASAALYRSALAIDPQWPEACALLAWILATHPDAARRDGREAVRWARMGCALTNDHPALLERLAAAHAEDGDFPSALDAARRGRRAALDADDRPQVRRFDAAIMGYEKGLPFRDEGLR